MCGTPEGEYIKHTVAISRETGCKETQVGTRTCPLPGLPIEQVLGVTHVCRLFTVERLVYYCRETGRTAVLHNPALEVTIYLALVEADCVRDNGITVTVTSIRLMVDCV